MRRMSQHFGTLALVTLASLAQPEIIFAGDSCAKVSIQGEGCENLEVFFDLHECGETLSRAKATIKCSKEGAKATFKTDRTRYRAMLSSKSEWGKTIWSVASIEQKAEPKVKPQRASASTVDATPAKLTPPLESVTPSTPNPPASASAPVAALPSSPAPAPSASPIQFGGFLDFSYMALFGNEGSVSQVVTARNPGNVKGRLYDQYNNSLQPNLVEMTLKRSGAVNFLLDLDFGTMADINAAGLVAPGAEDDVLKHVGQAVVSWVPVAAPWFLLEAGKLSTHVGYEVMKSKDNWQYGRSMTYSFGMPIFHTGVHLGFTPFPDRLAAGVYVYNGWNSAYEVNYGKTLGLQLKWTPTGAVTLIYNGIFGPEQSERTDSMRSVNEINAVYSGLKDLAFALEILYGRETNVVSEGDATWSGVSVHAKWNVLANSWLSPRVERYSDPNGYTTGSVMYGGAIGRTVSSYTLTAGQTLAEGLELRLEGRHDVSSQADFRSSIVPEKTQTSMTAALLYSF